MGAAEFEVIIERVVERVVRRELAAALGKRSPAPDDAAPDDHDVLEKVARSAARIRAARERAR